MYGSHKSICGFVMCAFASSLPPHIHNKKHVVYQLYTLITFSHHCSAIRLNMIRKGHKKKTRINKHAKGEE